MSLRTVGDVIQLLEQRAPSGTAESWDNVGLLSGDPAWKTSGAIVAIDLTREAISRAKERGYRLIVNHHPCIFPRTRGIARVVGGEGTGKTGLVFEAIRQGIAVAAYHTNFDRCALEVAEQISRGLGIVPRGRLLEKGAGSCVKLSVFVPLTHLEAVREALGNAGAGHLGDYDFCSFSAEGEGRFRGSDRTRPFLGRPGELESAREARLETIVPRGLEKSVLKALRASHPYEEIAYDLFPVEQAPASVGLIRGLGYGFWGEFPAPKPFSEVCKGVKTLFKAEGFLLTQPPPRKVRRLAFAAGTGSSVVEVAAALGCDLMITGEAGYHEALAVGEHRPEAPMAVMELGHRESERFFVTTMEKWLGEAGLGVRAVHVETQKFWKF